VHWQTPELTQNLPDYSVIGQSEAFRINSADIVAATPYSRQLFVFLPGTLRNHKGYNQLLDGVASDSASPGFYVARVTKVKPVPSLPHDELSISGWLEKLESESGTYCTLRVSRSFSNNNGAGIGERTMGFP
jgi:hypothetical protein